MMTLIETLALLLAALTLPGTVYLAVISLAGALPTRRVVDRTTAGRIALVVPAHNEATGIGATVSNLLALARHDGNTEVVVVADNCDDATADIAQGLGARVLVRNDAERRGKGYALDHAFRHLAAEDFLAYVVIDADTRAADNLLASLRRHFGAGARAVQCRYTVLNPDDSPRTRLTQIALAAFNVLRPRGRARMGLSAGIFGNGFALRQDLLTQIPYSAASVVEDLEYHLKLVAAGARVAFADDTEVQGEMPSGGPGGDSQRARWEGGRLRMLLNHGLPLAGQILTGRLRALEPLADLLLAPLGHHVMALTGLLALGLLLDPAGGLAGLGALGLAVVAGHVLIALRAAGLPLNRLKVLAHVPGYLLWKLRVLSATLGAARRNSTWVRTERAAEAASHKPGPGL